MQTTPGVTTNRSKHVSLSCSSCSVSGSAFVSSAVLKYSFRLSDILLFNSIVSFSGPILAVTRCRFMI